MSQLVINYLFPAYFIYYLLSLTLFIQEAFVDFRDLILLLLNLIECYYC